MCACVRLYYIFKALSFKSNNWKLSQILYSVWAQSNPTVIIPSFIASIFPRLIYFPVWQSEICFFLLLLLLVRCLETISFRFVTLDVKKTICFQVALAVEQWERGSTQSHHACKHNQFNAIETFKLKRFRYNAMYVKVRRQQKKRVHICIPNCKLHMWSIVRTWKMALALSKRTTKAT